MTVKGHLRYCGIMTLSTPIWLRIAAKLAGRMLASPGKYFAKVDRSAMQFPDPIPDMKHIYVDSAGVRLHAATHGLGSGKPLMLFLHGFPETWATWRHQLREYAGRYELVALDMRGYGGSDAPQGVRQYTMDKLLADVAAVIAATGHAKATVVGQDWGGGVAWMLAAFYPQLVERLVVIACPHPTAWKDRELFDNRQQERQWYALLFQSGLGEAYLRHGDFWELEKWMTQLPDGVRRAGAITEKDVERYKAAFARPGSLTAALNWYRANMAASTKWHTPAADKVIATHITCPTLLLYADKDSIFLPQMYSKTEEVVDDLSMIRLTDCSHWANQDRPDQVNANINSFLAGKLTSTKRPFVAPVSIKVKAGPPSGAAAPALEKTSLIQVPKQD